MIMTKTQYADFHDAVFQGLQVAWSSGTVSISFEHVQGRVGKVHAKCIGARNISLSRNLEWGESKFVNLLEVRDCSNGFKELFAEIQSGDTLTIQCEEIVFE